MGMIHHVSKGEGSPPMVFVHGFSCAHDDWDAQVGHFSPRHRTVAVDLRGHGATPGQASDCSIERYGADVAELMRMLDLPPAILVGHSMGCRVVVEAALQAPERAAGLVLVDGSQFAAAMEPAMRSRFAAPGGYAGMVRSMFEAMFTAKSKPSAAAHVGERAARLAETVGRKMLLDLARYDVHRLTPSMTSLRVPVMALQATYANEQRDRQSMSPGQTSPYLEMIRAAIPDARVETISDTGHFPQLDEPDETNRLIAAFVAAIA